MKLLTVAGRIRAELKEIERTAQRIPQGWQRAQETGDDLYLDSVALNLHSFYAGLERIFELIAQEVDNFKPASGNWHRELLSQMASEIPKVRPPVVSTETRDILDEYRGFRHLVRNIYAVNLSPTRMAHLVEQIGTALERAKSDLLKFADLLASEGAGE